MGSTGYNPITEPHLVSITRRAVHELGILLGQAPEILVSEVTPKRPILMIPPEEQVGLPVELLPHRPDVCRAEQAVAAATARIGVASADLFLCVFLTNHGFGLQSLHSTDLPLSSSGTKEGGCF